MAGLLRSVIAMLGITWALSVLVIGLIVSMAANERRREIGVLRALGAPRGFVLRSLLAEVGLLAAGGGLLGAALAGLAIYLFRDLLVLGLGMPFLLPSLPRLLALVAGGLGLALGTVALAAWLPAYRTSRQDPALAMRE
jgi:putative ABC transport system permease protein